MGPALLAALPLATWAAVDVIRRIQVDRVPFGTPRFHLMAPAVITVAAAAAVVLAGGALRADDQA